MKRPNLHHISAAFTALVARVDDGEVPDDLVALLDQLNLDLPTRIADCVEYRDWLRDEAESLKGRAAAFTALARKRLAVAETLADDIVRVMDAAGVKELPTPSGKVRVQQASRPEITWAGEGDVPAEFQRVKVELDGNKAWDQWRMTKELPEGFRVAFSRGIRVS